MEPRKLRILLGVGIAAMVIAIVCLIGLQSQQLDSSIVRVRPETDSEQSEDAVLTWDDILAQGSRNREEAEAASQGNEASASASGEDASEKPSASPEPTVSATPAPTPTPQPTPPAQTATILVGGGLIPYDARHFTVTDAGVPEVGGAKVIRFNEAGRQPLFQTISWEMDVRSADDVRGTRNGKQLRDKDKIATGTLVELLDEAGNVIDTAVVVIPGDVTGNADVGDREVRMVERQIKNPGILEGAFLLAADMDGSGTVDVTDLAMIQELVGMEVTEAAPSAEE